MTTLHSIEGLQEISQYDTGSWGVDVANLASSPTSPTIEKVVKESDGTDVKSTVMPSGSPSFSGTQMTWPAWAALTTFVGEVLQVHYSFLDNDSARRGRYERFKVVF